MTELWPCPPAQRIPDPSVSYPKEREPLLPSPFSSHFCQVGAKCQNPSKIQDQYFLETRAPHNLTPFLTHLKPPSPGISISRSAEPYYIECRVITQRFITKSSLPWKDSIFFLPKSQDLGCSFSNPYTRNLDCLQARHVLCLQARHLLCLQPRHLWCQQTRDLQSAKTSPGHCGHKGGRFAAAPVWAMRRGCLGRLQISCLLTQQMSWLQTQQMSGLQTQHMCVW